MRFIRQSVKTINQKQDFKRIKQKKLPYKKIAVSVVAAVFLMLLYRIIFSFSAQDAEESGSLSFYIAEKCVEIFQSLSGKQWSQGVMTNWATYWEHPIRKLAHFSEYAFMGVLVYTMWRPWKERNRRLYLLVVLWVALSAAGDEFHQLFVPGRYGSVADVLLDTCGGAFGVWCCVILERIVFCFCVKKRKKRENRELIDSSEMYK